MPEFENNINKNLIGLEPLEKNQPSTILEYLRMEHEKYIDDYKGRCDLVALSVAKKLIKQGKKPELIRIVCLNKDTTEKLEDIVVEPKMYDGLVQWEEHTVCICDNEVYDPMIGKPMELQEYLSSVFLNQVSYEPETSYQELKKILEP